MRVDNFLATESSGKEKPEEGKSLGFHGKRHKEMKHPEKPSAPVLLEEPVPQGRASASQPRWHTTGSAAERGISWFTNEDVEEEEEEGSSH